MNSRNLNIGHRLWPKPNGCGPKRSPHIVVDIRTVKGWLQFDVRTDLVDTFGKHLDPEHWLTFSQVRSEFTFNPPT